MTYSRRGAAIAALSMGAIAAGALASPAMAGTRADLDLGTNERFVSLSSKDGEAVYRISCPNGRFAYAGGAVAESIDNGGTLGNVNIASLGVTPGSPGEWAFRLSVGGGPASNGETPDDNEDVEDAQPTDGARRATVKLFVTCIGTETSEHDLLSFEWIGNVGGFHPSVKVDDKARKGGKYRRLVSTTETYAGGGSVPEGKTIDVDVRCASNKFGNYAIRGVPSNPGVSLGSAYLYGSEPRNNGWTYRIHNPEGAPIPIANYGLRVECVQKKTAKQRTQL